MKRRTKRYRSISEGLERGKLYGLKDAIHVLKQGEGARFDEAVELAMLLGVDPKHADQQVRGTVQLPHGTGKTVRVVVFAEGENLRAAQEAGADFVGGQDLVTRIQGGWMDFDATIATPDMMRLVGRLGKLLGPRGLMPSPKAGTVTMDVGAAVGELKAGRVEFRVDKQANLHMVVGRRSVGGEAWNEYAAVALRAGVQARTAAAKGQYLRSVCICTTMSAIVRLVPAGLGFAEGG